MGYNSPDMAYVATNFTGIKTNCLLTRYSRRAIPDLRSPVAGSGARARYYRAIMINGLMHCKLIA